MHQNMGLAGVLRLVLSFSVLVTLAACSNSSGLYQTVSQDSVKATDGQAITLENYRDHQVTIPVPPGNRNPRLSWATLYDNMPGDEPVADRGPDEEVAFTDDAMKSLKGTVKKWIGGKSTKKTFVDWKDNPAGLRAELDRRFTKQYKSILKQKGLKADFVAAGKAHGVDPIAILSCLLGENIFNVTGYDDAGTYYVRAKIMADKWALRFKANEVELTTLVKRPEFSKCTDAMRAGGSHAVYWDCVSAVWSKQFIGKTVDGVKYPKNGFKWTFFNPVGTGYSYGLGQLDPIRALMVTDQVHLKSGFRLLDIDRPEELYEDIINPQTTIHYVAANIRLMIDTYMKTANFDISKNPGVISTLYNLGGEGGRAATLYQNNLKSLKSGNVTLPIESYYGFYINEKEALIRQAFDRWAL